LCAEVGMQQARLSDWECGRAMPSIPYLVPVLGVLGYRLVITTEADA
jgi:transcriptional regulator with XRE-family HTH domain